MSISIVAIERGKPHTALRWTGGQRKTALPDFHRALYLLLLTAFQRETLLTATDQVSLPANHPILCSTTGKEEKNASLQDLKQPDKNNGQILWRI